MRQLIIVMLIFGFLYSCEEPSKNDPNLNCPELILTDNVSDSLLVGVGIVSLEIVDDCINYTLGFGGCDANHIIDLVLIEKIQENEICKFRLGFRDNNPQLCLAYFTEQYSYDLNLIKEQLGNNNNAELIFNNSEEKIVYQP